MTANTQDLNNLIITIFRFSIAFFCLLHALFVTYVVRQIMNMENLLSTLRRFPLIIFGLIHAIILIALLIYICILP
jgi:hypothetical protein